MNIVFPKLFKWQQEVYDYVELGSGQKISIVSVRQSGKTALCCILLIRFSLENIGTSVFISPTLNQSRKVFNDIIKMLDGSGLIVSNNASTLYIKFKNGSDIWFKSSEQNDSVRGLTVSNVLIFDETAFQPDEFIYTALPLARVHKAPTIFISTPLFAEGFFWDSTNSKDIRCFNWSQYRNEIYTPEEWDMYQRLYSKNKFRSEIMGEFIHSDGLLFNNIQECVGLAGESSKLYLGIDFSAVEGNDYTALSVLNERCEVVDIWYTNKMTPTERVDWLANIINKYDGVQKILAETNSIGNVYIDLLKKKSKYPITGFTTTNSSKQDLVNMLQLCLDNKDIKLKDDKELLKELQAYQATVNTNTKKVSYNAANGFNDDLVMALMLSLKALKSSYGKYNIN